MLSRRRALTWIAGGLFTPGAFAQAPGAPRHLAPHPSPLTPFAKVVPGYKLQFPRDEGSHPEFRVEWWYVTGWLEDAGKPLGFQVTFFRARPQLKHDNPSRFTPGQILIGHAALSEPARGRLLHDQRAARAGFGLAEAAEGSAHVWIDGWRLQQADHSYRAEIRAREFSIDLLMTAVQPPLLQGSNGYSRKGPGPESASYYYSIPHLQVGGTVARGGRIRRVTGTAWMDHEWSSQYLEEAAAGWDWIGINLDNGGALMAFRMRDRQGGPLWAGGSLRHPDGRLEVFAPPDVQFAPRREWKSTRTGTTYPVAFLIRAGAHEFGVEPLFDDQEHDARASTGTIYWEGAVRVLLGGTPAGQGYLELTGYWSRPSL